MTIRRLTLLHAAFMAVCWMMIVSAFPARTQETPLIQTGKIYDLKQMSKLLFHFERRVAGPPDRHQVVVRFLNPAGEELVRESVLYRGARFRSYTVDKRQTGERAEISVENGRIEFLYRGRNQKEKRNTESWDESVIVIDELPWFIQQNWTPLKARKSVPFRFVVPERAETVRFELLPRAATTCGGAPALLVEMRVRNSFLRLFAPKIQLTVSEQSPQSICEYTGPTSPYDAELREVQGLTVFE